jgi:hypothetical protein
MKHISIMPDLKESKESSWSNEETGQEAEPNKKVPEENGCMKTLLCLIYEK